MGKITIGVKINTFGKMRHPIDVCNKKFRTFMTRKLTVYGSDFIVPSKLFTYQKLKIFNILKKLLLQNYSF